MYPKPDSQQHRFSKPPVCRVTPNHQQQAANSNTHNSEMSRNQQRNLSQPPNSFSSNDIRNQYRLVPNSHHFQKGRLTGWGSSLRVCIVRQHRITHSIYMYTHMLLLNTIEHVYIYIYWKFTCAQPTPHHKPHPQAGKSGRDWG
jgi:hypothetical protein